MTGVHAFCHCSTAVVHVWRARFLSVLYVRPIHVKNVKLALPLVASPVFPCSLVPFFTPVSYARFVPFYRRLRLLHDGLTLHPCVRESCYQA